MATKKTIKTKKTKKTLETRVYKAIDCTDYSYKKGKKYEVALAGPVVLMANKITSFFKDFRDISVKFDEKSSTVFVYSTDYNMSDALNRFLVHTYNFGALTLNVKVVDVVDGIATVLDSPSWTITDDAMLKAFKMIFKHSPLTPEFVQAVDQTGTIWNFFEFPNYAITYQADSLLNIRGYEAVLAADVVKEIFILPIGYQISTYVYVEET